MADDTSVNSPGFDQNPYAQPQQPAVQPPQAPPVQQAVPPAVPPARQVPGRYRPCPSCGGVNVKKVGFTWWGGVLGPALFCHCKCAACGTTFNGKTGRSNNTAIAIYTAVGFGVAILIIVLMAAANL